MKRFGVMMMTVLSLFVLSSCACRHEWTEANCTTAKTCSLCEETEGEPLGHIWVEACEFPMTCSACSATEGQPLAHSEAVRDCAINYKTLKMERQTYCTNCDRILSSEEITLDTLHDGTHFLIDSKGFLERYTAIDAQFEFMSVDFYSDFAVVETTEDTLVLDCFDQYGYILRVSFTFCDLAEGSGEYAAPRCTGIVVNPAVGGELGEPDPDGMLDDAETSEELAAADGLRDLASTVALNDLMFRNLMIGFMVLDPSLETDAPNMDTWGVLLDIMDVLKGENPGFILNGIHYYVNENCELVIEVAS